MSGRIPFIDPALPVRRSRGFTLVELMTAVAIIAVLLALAGPGLGGFVRSSRINAAQSELVSSMMLARSEAAKRGQEVVLVATNRASGADFSDGWVVGWDKNSDGVIDTRSDSDEVIRTYPAPAAGVLLAPATPAAAVRFAATGFLSPATAFDFHVCDVRDRARGYLVRLEPVGLADVSSPVACP